MAPLNPSQCDEVEADALAFLILAGAINETPDFRLVYQAQAGAVLALVAAAHVNEDWIPDPISPTHPGFLDRMQVISELTEYVSGTRPAAGELGHPLGFLAQLQTFAGLSINVFLHENFPDQHRRVGLLDITNHLLRLTEDVNVKLQGFETEAEPGPAIDVSLDGRAGRP